MMSPSDRKKRILAAVIESYVLTAEPVGSKTLADKAGLGVSSATIRNEMSELEGLGWLMQPHTSSGRVPSPLGYRAYVNELMVRHRLSEAEKEQAHLLSRAHVTELARLLSEAGRIVSDLTGYPSITVTPKMNVGNLLKIDLITIDADRIVLVLVTSAGIVKHRLMYTEQPVPYYILSKLEGVIDERLKGMPISEMSLSQLAQFEERLGSYRPLLAPIIRSLREMLDELWAREVIVAGESRLLTLPEYQNTDKAMELLSLLHDRDRILKVLSPDSGHPEVRLTIGGEHPYHELKESTMITGSYKLAGKPVGVISVLGPIRMNYGRVLSQFEYFLSELNSVLGRMFNE